MEYRYRVKGIAEKAFILRGAHFRVGAEVNVYAIERELAFIKERCAIESIIDLKAEPNSIPNSTKSKKGVSNELQPKQSSRRNKVQNTAGI